MGRYNNREMKTAFTLRASSSVAVQSVSIETVAVVGAREISTVLVAVTDAERALIDVCRHTSEQKSKVYTHICV